MARVGTQVLMWPVFPPKSRLTFDRSKSVSLGQLWLELLRFYTLEFALEEYIISIRFKGLLSREMKNWPRRRLAIEGECMWSGSPPRHAALPCLSVPLRSFCLEEECCTQLEQPDGI